MVWGNSFQLSKGISEHGYLPSIDVTMRSVAKRFGADACGVLLTGIGRDGAEGIAEVHDAGGCTIVQDEASCVAFGMPKAAIATGKVDCILSDQEVAAQLVRMCAQR